MASGKDYYDILGVSKDASENEIKSAFRKLAKQYHPDNKQTGDEAKFKEIGEAYAVLSDETKRRQYDQFGSPAFQNGEGAGGYSGGFGGFGGFDGVDINLDDILGDLFGGGFSGGFGSSARRSGPRRGPDVKVDVDLTFDEAVFGCKKDIKLDLNESCSECFGKGGFDEITCPNCGGRGRVVEQQSTIFGVMQTQKTCPTCKGKGKSYKKTCSECSGTGLIKSRKTISVDIPEGVDNGYELRISGKGEAGINGGPNGDIYLEFHVKEHPLFERDGKDIYLEVPITITDAILGCKKEVPTLTGSVVMQIDPGTQNYTKLKLKGKGIKSPKSNTKGDMYVVVNIIMPTKLNRQQKDLLEQLSQTDLETDDSFKKFRKYL